MEERQAEAGFKQDTSAAVTAMTGGAIDESTNPHVVRIICRDGVHSDNFTNPNYYSITETEAIFGHIKNFLDM